MNLARSPDTLVRPSRITHSLSSLKESSFLGHHHPHLRARLPRRSQARPGSVLVESLFGFGKKKKRQSEQADEIASQHEEKAGDGELGNKLMEVKDGQSQDFEVLTNTSEESHHSSSIQQQNAATMEDTPRMMNTDERSPQSGGDEGKQLPPWWSELPYLCVLVTKRDRSVFMLDMGAGKAEHLCAIGFEDPQDAKVAEDCLTYDPVLKLNPFRRNRTQVFDQLGIRPADPKIWKSHVESTWLSPKEFVAMLLKKKIDGEVMPAGTLRDFGQNFRNVEELVKQMKKVCLSGENPEVYPDEILDGIESLDTALEGTPKVFHIQDTSDAVVSDQTQTLDGQMLDRRTGDELRENGSLGQSSPASYVDGSFFTAHHGDLGIPHNSGDQGNGKAPLNSDGGPKVGSLVEGGFLVSGKNSGYTSKGRDQSASDDGSPSTSNVSGFDDPSLEKDGTSIHTGWSEIPSSVNGFDTREANGKTQQARKHTSGGIPWWSLLNEIHIPQVKRHGEKGGVVEVNFAIIPDYTDYRMVLFEDRKDAQHFLGVFGPMVSEDAMVGVLTQQPREFLAKTSEEKLKGVVVLSKGSLMVSRDMNYRQVVGAIRFANQMTARDHGEVVEQNVPWEVEKEAGVADMDLDTPMREAAEDMLSDVDRLLRKAREHGIGAKMSDKTEEAEETEDSKALGDEFSNFMNQAMQESLNNSEKKLGDIFLEQPPEPQENSSSLNRAQQNGDASFSQNGSSLQTDGAGEKVDPVYCEDSERASASSSSSGTGRQEDETHNSRVVSGLEGDTVGEDDEENGFKVVYPPGWKKGGENTRRGPRWYMALPMIYLPQYIDESGEVAYMAFHVGEQKQPIVLGFQDPLDARRCCEVMQEWESHGKKSTGVQPVPPGLFLERCQTQAPDVELVILRKESLPLNKGMKLEELVGLVEMFHQLQNGDFSSLQQG